jgi:hypothetical protein
VTLKGLHAAMISTISEYKDPQDDIEAAVRLLGDVQVSYLNKHMLLYSLVICCLLIRQTSFVWASPLFAPTDQHDKVWTLSDTDLLISQGQLIL